MQRVPWILPAIALLTVLACGGGANGGGAASTPRSTVPATQLAYASPSGATTWRLVEDPASSTTHLVLDLLAPAGTSGQGITLILSADPSEAIWTPVAGSSYAVQAVYPNPKVSLASVSGSELRILFGQAQGTPVSYGAAPVLQVACDLAPGAVLDTVTFNATQAGHLGTAATPVAITVAVGTLLAQ